MHPTETKIQKYLIGPEGKMNVAVTRIQFKIHELNFELSCFKYRENLKMGRIYVLPPLLP